MKPVPSPVKVFAHRGASGYAPENAPQTFIMSIFLVIFSFAFMAFEN
jgi:glycerophosphoryl diester phosphodiesterase